MRRRALVAAAAVVSAVLVGWIVGSGVLAQTVDPKDQHIQSAIDELQAALALPPHTVTETITETATITETQTVTASPTTTTTTSSSPTTTTTLPPAPGFPSRAEALARANVVVVSGTRTTQYKPGPATETTYDFRGLTSTAYPSTGYPIVLEGTRNVAIGGTVLGQQPRDWTWAQVHDTIGGYGERMFTTDYSVSYDFRVDNVTDGLGFDPSSCGTAPGPATCEFLVEGAYLTWIRDDGIEFDTEFSGTVRDVLMDGVNNAFSIGQSTKNANAVTNIENVLIVHAAMNNDRAADGAGHQTLFKQAPGGRVNLTNVTDCLYENPITPSRIGIRPPGTWTNVTFVLGPGWVGPDPAVPNGATVSHDWQGKCINAADAWRAAHGL